MTTAAPAPTPKDVEAQVAAFRERYNAVKNEVGIQLGEMFGEEFVGV